jgi:hypothetical protein
MTLGRGQFLLGSSWPPIVIAAVINRWAGLAVFIVLTAGVPFEGQSTADREFWVVTHQRLAAQAGGE